MEFSLNHQNEVMKKKMRILPVYRYKQRWIKALFALEKFLKSLGYCVVCVEVYARGVAQQRAHSLPPLLLSYSSLCLFEWRMKKKNL